MGSALLSRFDLVFILLDTPNEQHDHLLSEHVIAIRAGKQRAVSSAAVARVNSQDSNTSVLEVVSEKPLSERLKVHMLIHDHLVWFCLNVEAQCDRSRCGVAVEHVFSKNKTLGSLSTTTQQKDKHWKGWYMT